MSDFLRNLIGRSLGTLEVVRPRVPSLYEPYRQGGGVLRARPGRLDPGFESTTETDHGPETNPAPEASSAASPSLAAMDRAISRPRMRQDMLPRSQGPSGEAAADAHPAADPRPAAMPASALPYLTPRAVVRPPAAPAVRIPLRDIVKADSIAQPSALAANIEPDLPATGLVFDGKNQVPTISAPSAAGMALLATNPAPPAIRPVRPSIVPRAGSPRIPTALSPADATPPTVQVSIGRVEVRAIFPEPQTRRPAPPRPRPAVSLDDYLNRRNGGRR